MSIFNPGRKKLSSDSMLYIFNYTGLSLFLLAVLLPLVFIVSASFSSPAAVSSGQVFLWPVKPCLDGYRAVFTHRYILSGYLNTCIYTVTGTFASVCVTMIAAYGMSRRDVPFRGIIMGFFVLTLFFSGGLIPTYIVVARLNLVDKIWALILPGAMSVYNMILVRTFIISNIPGELLEVSLIDGCSDIKYLTHIVVPLSKAVIAVIVLFLVVAHWNSYFPALIYLNGRNKYPLQLIMREILIINQFAASDMMDPKLIAQKQGLSELLKYSLIIVSSLPILLFYPFIQKYFVTGVMIGSIKG